MPNPIIQVIPYYASVWLSTAQTIPGTNTLTTIGFDSVNDDPYGLWDNTLKRFVVGTPGYFRFSANIPLNSVMGNTSSALILVKNGVYSSPGIRLNQMYNEDNPTHLFLDVTLSGEVTDYASSATDYYELGVIRNDIPADFGGINFSRCRFQIEKVS